MKPWPDWNARDYRVKPVLTDQGLEEGDAIDLGGAAVYQVRKWRSQRQ